MMYNKKKLFFIFINLVIWIGLISIFFTNLNSDAPDGWARKVSISALTLLVIQIIEMKIFKISIKNYMFWFIILQYLFYYGRIFLYWLDLDKYVAWHLFSFYNTSTMFHAALFSLCFSQGIFLGMFLKNNKRKNPQVLIEKKNKIYSGKCMLFIGICILILTLPFLLIYDYNTIMAQNAGKYIAVADINGVTLALSQIFFVGILFLVCTPEISKKKTFIIVFLYFIYGIIYMTLAADRRATVVSFIVLIVCCFSNYKIKLDFKKVIAIIVIGYLGLNLLSAISTVRTSGINFDSLKKQMSSQVQENNILISTSGEFGLTFFSIVNAMSYYPDRLPFVVGKTYIASILILIPEVSTKLFNEISSAASITSNMKAIDGNPLGGSLAQDLFANFGNYGVFISIILGYLLAKITNEYEFPTSIDICKYYIKFYILLNLVRAGIYEMSRAYVYSFFLIYLLAILYNQKNKKNLINKEDKIC